MVLVAEPVTAKVIFTAEYDEDGKLMDVTWRFDDREEPFSLLEFHQGTATREFFDAAWSYFRFWER